MPSMRARRHRRCAAPGRLRDRLTCGLQEPSGGWGGSRPGGVPRPENSVGRRCSGPQRRPAAGATTQGRSAQVPHAPRVSCVPRGTAGRRYALVSRAARRPTADDTAGGRRRGPPPGRTAPRHPWRRGVCRTARRDADAVSRGTPSASAGSIGSKGMQPVYPFHVPVALHVVIATAGDRHASAACRRTTRHLDSARTLVRVSDDAIVRALVHPDRGLCERQATTSGQRTRWPGTHGSRRRPLPRPR